LLVSIPQFSGCKQSLDLHRFPQTRKAPGDIKKKPADEALAQFIWLTQPRWSLRASVEESDLPVRLFYGENQHALLIVHAKTSGHRDRAGISHQGNSAQPHLRDSPRVDGPKELCLRELMEALGALDGGRKRRGRKDFETREQGKAARHGEQGAGRISRLKHCPRSRTQPPPDAAAPQSAADI
jgi:hypothetical protein